MAEFHRLRSRHDPVEPEAWKAYNAAAEQRARAATTANMPSLEHLTRADYQHVYEPAEDTYLLLDALLYEFEQGVFDKMTTTSTTMEMQQQEEDLIVLEIGCGTGVPSVWFRQEWHRRYPDRPIQSYVTDINPRALQVALQTDEHNNSTRTTTTTTTTVLSPLHAVQCDLAGVLLETLRGAVHVLIFNPPYVPTPDDEVVDFSKRHNESVDATNNQLPDDKDDSMIAAAWAGGTNGRRVVDRALPQIQQLLLRGDASSAAYLVTVDDNQPAALATLCATQYQLHVQPLLRRRAHNEYLTIQKMIVTTEKAAKP